MATVTVFPYSTDGTVHRTMTQADWETEFAHMPVFAVEDDEGNINDYSSWVANFEVAHEDIDADGAGRDPKTGKMVRKFVTNKHTLNVTMINHLPQVMARRVFRDVYSTSSHTSHTIYYHHPCSNDLSSKDMYCSNINYGAQRYDRITKRPFYDGMKFNLIQM